MSEKVDSAENLIDKNCDIMELTNPKRSTDAGGDGNKDEGDHEAGDSGWDESESLAERIRKQSEEEEKIRQRKSESPKEGPTAAANKRAGDAGIDRANWRNDHNKEVVEADESNRPSIWKELEKMQTRARGGGGGMPRGFRQPIAPRFSKPHEPFQDNRQGGPRFDNRRGRADWHGNRGGGSRHAEDSSYERSVSGMDDNPLDRGGGDQRSFSTRRQNAGNDSRISKDSAAFRSMSITLRGRGGGTGSREGRGIDRDFGGSGRSPARKGYLDRQIDDDDNDMLEPSHQRKADNRHATQRRVYDTHSDEPMAAKAMDKNVSHWPIDADVGAGNRTQAQRTDSTRESPIFESLIDALDNLDHSNRSMKHLMTLVLNIADDFCKDDTDRWLKLIDQYILEYAADEGDAHVEFACSLFGRLIDRAQFQQAAYIALSQLISDLMLPREWTEKDHREGQNICDLFGRLLIHSWPPGWDSCAKECNMIVYSIMNAVQTWLRVLDQTTSRRATIRDEIVEASAVCLWYVTMAAGRKLWLRWPDLIDQMYTTVRMVIVSQSCRIHEETKLKLLDLYVKLNEWPKPASQQSGKNVSKRQAATQTDTVQNPVAITHSSWMSPTSAFESVSPSYVIGTPAQSHGQNRGQHPVQSSAYPFPPPPLAFTPQFGTGTEAMLQNQRQQQQQQMAIIRGTNQPPPRSYIGPMGKQ